MTNTRKNLSVYDNSLTIEKNCQVQQHNQQTEIDNSLELCIHQMFEAQVERSPDAVAVVFENKQLTYRQLNQQANQLAYHLRALGVEKEVLVGICVERSLEMVVGLLGILKAGGAYVPLDPAYPQERLAFIMEDTQTPVLLTQKHLVHNLPTCKAQIVCLDGDREQIAQNSQDNLVCKTTGDNLIYVIYTSGSTGQPKGVMIPHRGICNQLYWRQTSFGLTQADKVLQTISFSFDPSVWQIFWCLSFGGQLILPHPGGHQDTAYLVKTVIDKQITILALVPSILRVLLEEEGIENCKSLRHITCGGEALPIELVERFFTCLNLENVLHNCYGPTEASIDTTFWTCQRGTHGIFAPIGRPISHAEIYVLDENLQPVPVGEPGELHIGGVGLARGYFNRPELTDEKFIPNPFNKATVKNSFGLPCLDRLYKTGDLVRYLPDGNIEFLGRIDHQVKIRGFRIELGEIEAKLGTHPAVQQTLVMAREDVPGDKQLVAYVVVDPEQNSTQRPSHTELRLFLQDKLPHYVIPASFVFLDTMPLNPNGKVNRHALPAPDKGSYSKNNFVEPLTPIERVLSAIWAEVLGLEVIGIHDNFFELGGHSLLATQVMSRIRRALGVEIKVKLLFETPTIANLANAIAVQNQGTGSCEDRVIPRLANRRSAPLSFAQQRVWFLEQLEPNSPTYIISQALRLQGTLDVSVLQQSLDAIVAHHEALRTNFIVSVDGSPIQVFQEPRSMELKVIDFTQEQKSEINSQVLDYLNQEAQRPFNLSSDLMLRAALCRVDHQEHVLLLVMHHIASDGWSMGILWEQLATVYEAFSNKLPNPLPKLPIQYADFAVWQHQWLSGQVLNQQLDYWKAQLAGANTVLELPSDKPRPPVQTYRGAMQSLILPQILATSLTARSQQEGVTLFMTLLAAFGTLLHRYTGQEDILIGSPIAGRDRAEIEDLIGFFINTVVLRINCSGNPSFSTLLNRVRQMALEAYTHQDMPFEKLVQELQPERDTSRNPLFQVWFNMLNLKDIKLELPGLVVEPIHMPEAASKFDLTLYVTEQQQGIKLELVYNADLFEPERIVEMLTQFHHLLVQIGETPQQNISCLSLVTPKAELLLPNPQRSLDLHSEIAVHTKFSQQVQRVPQNLAVVDARVAWTYAELEELSNQLAHYLLANNIQSQDVVAIYGQRNALLVVAILGVLKAGGAFVILDPAYPASRLIDCLEIVQPRAWLQIASDSPVLECMDMAVLSWVQDLKKFWNRRRTQMDADEAVFYSGFCCLEISYDSILGALQSYSKSDPQVIVEPDDLAYVAFTSGSTGKPKGVKGSHRPLSHFVLWHQKTFGLCESDKFSMLSGLSHDPLLRDIFTPLSLGATLCVPQQEEVETLGQLADWMRVMRISVAHLTPSMAHLLTVKTASQTIDLRYVFFAGDVLTQQDVTKIRRFAPQVNCVNFYGATETPQAMGYFVVSEDCGVGSVKETIPLGRGIEDVQLLVLTHTLQLAGIGELGEIYIRTPYLSSGYIGSDALTQERFIVNPFTKISTDRLYKTGDLGRYLPNGNIEFCDRIDNQVKIRGFRMELGEIEVVLSQYASVQEVVVLLREDILGDKQLVAYVVLKEKQISTANELRQFLTEKLPRYMIPACFVMLEALPLTPNGKVDRAALPAPEVEKKTFVAPRNELERELVEMWEQVLGIQPIGVRDNFFELGGHSLLAVKLFAQIEQKFTQKLLLATLFQSGTVEAIAKILSQYKEEELVRWSCLVPIQPEGSKPPLFCIHPLGGEILCYYSLAQHLGLDRPFYGIQPQGIDGKLPFLRKIEDMAALYIREIQSIQPQGPYFLSGYSLGGIIAYEMAQQLYLQGEQIGMLAMLDTCLPGYSNRLPFFKRMLVHFSNLLEQGPAYLWQKFGGLTEWTQHNITNKYLEYLRISKSFPENDLHVALMDASVQAVKEYTFKRYSGPMTLLRTSDKYRDKEKGVGMQYDPQFGWGDVVMGEIDVHLVPGSHLTLFEEPHVKVLAVKLKNCLEGRIPFI
ncbi:non-ribosomal peptide synthetase [Scytonema hofmannii PCC 7110]|uniref:Non-ribosomal peptide synthetase n=1 Tax=Scytonema hofmannii PCC 7110 TaxID=128403 RepID=A0A139WVY1_9CYAN|nr:non-ribosomal peptide synthetase [Scytonema hofmannii]KYC36562.1 non-ribosomal peptide synthetase [Scytonema hofmannii PCC 7110]